MRWTNRSARRAAAAVAPSATGVTAVLLVAVLLSACGVGDTPAARAAQTSTTQVAGPVPAQASGTAATGAAGSSAARTPPAAVVAAAAPNPCARNASAQLVRVSLHRQHLWMCAHRHLAYQTGITSGVVGEYTSTPKGDYSIQGLDRNTTLTLNTGQQFTVKYWIPFDAPLFGFHDSPWQKFAYGSQKYRTRGSHGCVHMPLRAIAFLYHWAHVGAKVRIRA